MLSSTANENSSQFRGYFERFDEILLHVLIFQAFFSIYRPHSQQQYSSSLFLQNHTLRYGSTTADMKIDALNLNCCCSFTEALATPQ